MRKIDQIILSSQWEIEPFFGLQVLSKYAHELDLISKGVSLSEINYSDQRAELEPMILNSAITGRSGLSSSEIPENSIAKLSLSGAMRLSDGLSSRGVKQLTKDIAAADANTNIAGILLEVNSGGGEVTAGTELKNALDDVRRNGKTKVVVYTQMMASAAIRGTLPVDYIIANNESAQIGSIGTMMTVNKEFLEYAKENFLDIYAKQSTKKNEGYKALLKGDLKPLVNMLTESNQHFINDVDKYRKITGTNSEINEVMSGKLFTADIALERGLINAIGTFGEAVEKLQSLIQESNPKFGSFYNSTNTAMKFSLASFVASIGPKLNNLLFTDIKEDATPEAVIEALNNVESFETRMGAMKDELTKEQEAMKDELVKDQEAMKLEMDTKLTDLTAKVEVLQEENEALKTEKVELENKITELEAKRVEMDEAKSTLETQLADLTGKRENPASDGSTEDTNSSAPKIEPFETAAKFYGAVAEPKGDSKY